MSAYSELLKQYTDEKNIKIAKLTEYCNLDRSTMYKIMNGKRNPPSIETARRIANYMQLSFRENGLYFDAYYRSVLGEDAYAQNMLIREFIYGFNDICNKRPIFFEINNTPPDVIDDYPIHMLRGRTEINYHLKWLLEKVASRENANIMMITQCDNQYLLDTLLAQGEAHTSMKIRHILCFQNRGPRSNENINILKKLIPFYGCKCSYEPYYYYDNVDSHFYNMNLFCNVIIYDDGVLCYTSDYQFGQILRDPECVDIYKDIFMNYLSQSYPLLTKVDSILDEYLTIGLDVLKTTSDSEAYSLHSEPCIVPFITNEIMERSIKKEIPHREEVMKLFIEFIVNERKVLNTGNFKCFFTLKGIEDFINSGRVSEIPENFYEPLTKDACIAIIKNMMPYFKNGTYHILKNEIALIDSNLHIFVSLASSHLIFSKNSNELVYIYLNEPGMIQCFMDFMKGLNEDESFYNSGETVQQVTALLQKYETE